jgi:hypothetical protein
MKFVIEGVCATPAGMPMTKEQIDDHIKELRRRATELAMKDYPSGNEDELKKWRSDVDIIRRDLKLLAFLSHYLPNVTMQKIGF